ncbi:MAG: hypothetical protein J6J76_01850, partial [Paraprevotella sp.]|nr:hypothetical protein [Paraprevotella sp.]
SAREGSYIPLYNVIQTERSDEGSCCYLQMKEILPPYGRQNDRIEDHLRPLHKGGELYSSL